jgi:hypothetical protein
MRLDLLHIDWINTTLHFTALHLALLLLILKSLPLLPCPVRSPFHTDLARWFARLLLEGSVLPELRSVLRRDRLKDSPALITQMKPSTKVRRTNRQTGCILSDVQ